MTAYLVTLTSGRVAEVTADEITTRPCGALFLLRAEAKPPAPLVTVAAFSAREWRLCIPKDTSVVYLNAPPTTPASSQIAAEPRFA